MNLSMDYYERHSTDILDKPAMSLTLGVIPNNQWLNTSDMVNKGIEVSIGWNDRIKDFKYGAMLNVSYNTNKITQFRGGFRLRGCWWTVRHLGTSCVWIH